MKIFLHLFCFGIILVTVSCENTDEDNLVIENINTSHSKEKPTTAVNANLNDPSTFAIEDYPYKLLLRKEHNVVGAGSCFFIKYAAKMYMVTARHLLYEEHPVNKELEVWRELDGLTFLVYDKRSDVSKSYNVQISKRDPKINSVIVNGYFADALIIELFIPATVNINFVDFIDHPKNSNLKGGVRAYIAGFPSTEEHIKVVETTVSGYYKQYKNSPATILALNDASIPGVSGGPVFIQDPSINGGVPEFFGVYQGITQFTDRNALTILGTVTNGKLITDFFH